MASTIIHLAIAKKVAEELQAKNKKDYYLGSIAPDISKQIGQEKKESHFIMNTKDETPNLDLFMKRYPIFYHNSFNLGYFTHLYTDKVWEEEFLPNFINKDSVKLLDGTIVEATKEEMTNMIYSDYTNLNKKIIDDYALDLALFYEDFTVPDTSLIEVPIENLDILLNKAGIIIENAKEEKTYTFDMNIIHNFIEDTAKRIIKEVKNISE